MSKLPEGPTKIVVGGVIGVSLVAATFALVGLKWGLFCMGLLIYEGWTFFNKYKNDTISEVIWVLTTRPLVPMLFGLGMGWAISTNYIPISREGIWTAFSIGILYGHFFFQRQNGHVVEDSEVRS